MGLTNNTSLYSTIVTIVGGKFTVRVPDGEDNPNAVERVLAKGPNMGKTVKELHYSNIEGLITDAALDKNDFGTNLILTIEDSSDSYKVQIPVDSQYFAQFAKRVPNLDPSLEVFIGLGYDREDGRNFMYVKQGGEPVRYAFTRENENGMPQPVKRTIKGEEKWDFSEQENFLYEVVEGFVSQFN